MGRSSHNDGLLEDLVKARDSRAEEKTSEAENGPIGDLRYSLKRP